MAEILLVLPIIGRWVLSSMCLFVTSKNFGLLKKGVLLFFVCLGYFVKGQVLYSTDQKYLKSKTEQNNLISHYNPAYPDSSISELSNYFPRNFMGNVGLPSPNYLFIHETDNLGFKFFEAPTLNDRFLSKDIAYYRSVGPYANLEGIAGSKQLQIFKMLFTQTYKERLNFTLKFNRYTSLGYYQKQQTYSNNFYLSSNFNSRNNRFGYYFYVLNNGNKNSENGGIKDGVINDSTVSINKELMGVKLSSANRDNRELKLMLNPWFRLNKKTDSLNGIAHYLQVKSAFANNSYRYKDVGIVKDNFYKKVYLDTVKTLDSSHVRQLVNEFNYVFQGANNKLLLSAGYKNEINQVWQKIDSVFMNHLLQAECLFENKMDTTRTKKFSSGFNVQYVLNGPNSGNYKIENKTVLWTNEKQKNFLFATIIAESRNADYIYNNWISNHFLWFNKRYKSQQEVQSNIGWSYKNKINLNFFYQNIFNYLYFDNSASPAQYKKTIENIGISAQYNVVLFKHLGLSFQHLFQGTSKPTYIRIPQNISTAKLFYTGNLFKNNLQLQIGSQVQVYQSFKAYNYMPSTQAFYLQDNSTTAACPFLDIYLNARIRPVTVFLKVENALQGFVGNNYSFVPGYYQTDRTFRFGISWMFFDWFNH